MSKGIFSTNIVSKELWKEFKKTNNISWEEFYNMWQDIADTIRQETIENPLGVKLGAFMGELKYQYLPYDFKSVDIVNSTKLGEKVNYVSLISRGKQGKIKWERRWAVKFNKMLQFYAFEPTRKLVRLADKYITSNPEKLRVSRNTLGGYSIWRQLKNYGK